MRPSRPHPAAGAPLFTVRSLENGPCTRARQQLQRDEGRRLFGRDPVGYRAGSPDYPEAVYEILVERAA
jgi:hypothetical protein